MHALSDNELREGKIEYLDAERRSQGGWYKEMSLTTIVAVWAGFCKTPLDLSRTCCTVPAYEIKKNSIFARILLIGAAFVALCWLSEPKMKECRNIGRLVKIRILIEGGDV